MVASLLQRAGWRHLRHHPWQSVLAVLGIGLGVAVVVAVDLANQSARRAFELSLEGLTGRATHQITAGPGGIDETLYRRLRVELGLEALAPVVEGYVGLGGETLHLLGVDPLAEGPIRDYAGRLRGERLARLITDPATVLLARSTAARHGLAPGARLALEVGGVTRQVELIGLLEPPPERAASLDGLLITDIATAQELLGRLGRLDRMDLILPDAAAARELAAALPPGVQLMETAARTQGLQALTRAFHTNLSAMSLLALLVGGFLIYNSMTFSVLQRRHSFATLRLLGLTSAGLLRLVLLETLWLGLAGSLLGVALGYALAGGLLQMVTRTINDLYFVLNVTGLHPAPVDLLKGLALGLATALLAALGPALEAGRVSPLAAQRRSVLERASHRAAPWLAAGGLALAGGGWLLLERPAGSLIPAFAGLFLLIVGYSLAVPLALLLLARLLGPALGATLGSIGRLAARGLSAGLSRTGLATAALTVAVSATVGVGVMISSFRSTVADWLGQTLRGDVYVSAPASVSSRASGTLAEGVVERIRDLPGIAAHGTGRSVTIDSPQGELDLLALKMVPQHQDAFRFKAGRPQAVWPEFLAGRGVIVSEPLAYRRGLSVGQTLELYTDRGPRALPVLGVFYDYASTRGLVIMSRGLYDRLWDDPHISTVSLYLAPGARPEAVLAAVRAALAEVDQRLLVRPAAEIRAHSLAVFDRTFAITHVLRLLVVGVALVGVLSALLALQLERAKEHAVLRATGLTPAGLLGLVSLQTLLMGLAAGLLALPLGLGMAQALIDVINLRAFGWSLQTHWSPRVLAEAVALAATASLLAGVYPALRMGRVSPAGALREE